MLSVLISADAPCAGQCPAHADTDKAPNKCLLTNTFPECRFLLFSGSKLFLQTRQDFKSHQLD